MKGLSVFIPIIILSFLLNIWGGNDTIQVGDNSQIIAAETPEQFIVHFKPGVSPERKSQIYVETGASPVNKIQEIAAEVVKVPPFNIPSQKKFSDFSEVDSVEPDSIATVAQVPDDSSYNQQWGLVKIQAPQAWDITRSASTIKIAILDSGIDTSHTDLSTKITVERNFTDSPDTKDIYGHGTHVAGIAAASTNNNLGVAGVGYNSSLMNVKVINDSGAASYSWIIQGVIWAADNGANIINLSMGGDVDSASLKDAVDYAWNKGAVIVVAAGNNGKSTPHYPAYYSNSIAVAATDQNDHLCSYSNHGNWVDVAAPGSALSTMPGNSYGTKGGTSMAAPFVSGLAGLAFAVARDTNGNGRRNDEIRDALQTGCVNIGLPDTGSGRINAYNTIISLAEPAASPPIPALSPAPVIGIFGLSGGEFTYTQKPDVLNVQRFQNTAGTGILTGLELLVSSVSSPGKARLAVYADNNGSPGNLLLEAGEVDLTNGWAAISGLNLPVTSGGYYWLANIQNGRTVLPYHLGTNGSNRWYSQSYGSMPGLFPTGTYSSPEQYVMRATVTVSRP